MSAHLDPSLPGLWPAYLSSFETCTKSGVRACVLKHVAFSQVQGVQQQESRQEFMWEGAERHPRTQLRGEKPQSLIFTLNRSGTRFLSHFLCGGFLSVPSHLSRPPPPPLPC